MEICPYCGGSIDDIDVHFNGSARCYRSWLRQKENMEKEKLKKAHKLLKKSSEKHPLKKHKIEI